MTNWEKRRARWAAFKRTAEEQLKTRLGEETGKMLREEMIRLLRERKTQLDRLTDERN